MYNDWNVDMKDSVIALSKIKYLICEKHILGKIHTIESVNNEVLMLLDIKSGIDYISENESGLRGIAARVQWGKAWNTFTIRSKRISGSETELSKRKEQIANGYIYPYFTMQAYFDDRQSNNLLSLCICRTVDLYEFIDLYPEMVHKRKSDNDFIYVIWDEFKKYYKVREEYKYYDNFNLDIQ